MIGKTPHGHLTIATFVAPLRCDALTAPLVIDRPMSRPVFPIDVTTFPLATLRPDDIVVMDNLAAHKAAGVAAAIENVGAHVLYVPAYSPDLNPIEQVFTKPKALLRNAKARTIDDLRARIATALAERSAQECAYHAAHAGYGAI